MSDESDKALLEDRLLQDRLARAGYAVLESFLEPSQVDRLAALHASTVTEELSDTQVFFSAAHSEKDAAVRIDREIRATVQDEVTRWFGDATTSCCQFIIKKADSPNILPPHQDLSSVDETRDRAAMMWIPLRDVDLESGTVGFVPGSHLFFPDVRCSPTACQRTKLPYVDYATELFPYMDFPKLRRGDAVVWDAAVIHGSLANRSSLPRIAATVGLSPPGTRTFLNFFLPGTELSKYERFAVQPSFFLEHDESRMFSLFERGKKPDWLESLGVFDHSSSTVDREQMIRLITAAGGREDPTIAASMAS